MNKSSPARVFHFLSQNGDLFGATGDLFAAAPMRLLMSFSIALKDSESSQVDQEGVFAWFVKLHLPWIEF
jgi:hypothetical protein